MASHPYNSAVQPVINLILLVTDDTTIVLQVHPVRLALSVSLVLPVQWDHGELQDSLDFRVWWELLEVLDRLDHQARLVLADSEDLPEA